MPVDCSTHARTLRSRPQLPRLRGAACICAAVCATLLGGPSLPVRADLSAPPAVDVAGSCEARTKEAFAAIAMDNPDNPRVTADGCGTAVALATCHVQGSAGPCRDVAECPDAIVTVEDACNAAIEAMSCCVVLYRRGCDTCPPEPFACGQFCSDAMPRGAPVGALTPPLAGQLPPVAAGGAPLGGGGLVVAAADGAAPTGVDAPATVGLGVGPASAGGEPPAADTLGLGGEGVDAPQESAAAGSRVWIRGWCGSGTVAGVCGCGVGVAASALAAATSLLQLM